MKEATGEMNMTVVTIIAIGAIIAFFWLMWPTIQSTISGQITGIGQCPEGYHENNEGLCVMDEKVEE